MKKPLSFSINFHSRLTIPSIHYNNPSSLVNRLRRSPHPTHTAPRSHSTLVKAITYTENGDPGEVLRYSSYTLPGPKADQLQLKMKLSPLNPADINTIQGRYPWKPKLRTDLVGLGQSPVYIAGNEGLGVVQHLGPDLDPTLWQPGDWVIMGKPQLGTWQSHANLSASEVIKVRQSKQLTDVQAATMSVNLATAYRLIKDFYHFEHPHFKDGWIIQNGANSSVGQYVLQLCKAWGIGCIGLVRDRPQVEKLKIELLGLGAVGRTKVLTYEEFQEDRSLRSELKALNICLGFNCVSGSVTSELMKVMRSNSSLITYGGMSMKPIVVPTSSLIFKNLQLKGFMLTQSLSTQPLSAKEELINELLQLVEDERVSAQTNTQIIQVDSLQCIRDVLKVIASGQTGKKYLLGF